MPINPYNDILFDHIDGFDFLLIFWVLILSYLPILQDRTTAGFPALRSSHNRPYLAALNRKTIQCLAAIIKMANS